MSTITRVCLPPFFFLLAGCGTTLDIRKSTTAEGYKKPVALVFEPFPSDNKFVVHVASLGRLSDSYVVLADNEKAAIDMVDVDKNAIKPGATLLGKIDGKEVGDVEVTVPGGKKFAVVTYLVTQHRGEANQKIEVNVMLYRP